VITEKSAELKNLFTALAKVQAEIDPPTKDAKVDAGAKKYRYATLANVWDACRGPLSKHGLSLTQHPGTVANGVVTLTTVIGHVSGEYMISEFEMPAQITAQGVGSAITYACRYSLMAILGIPPEDDDGQAATATAKTTEARTVPTTIKPAPAKSRLEASLPREEVIKRIGANRKLIGDAQALELRGKILGEGVTTESAPYDALYRLLDAMQVAAQLAQAS
jgi:hypothetical protein